MNYFVLNELTGEQVGPYEEEQVRQLIARKKIKPKTLVRSVDSDWQRAGVLLKSIFISVQEQQQREKQAAAEAKRGSSESIPEAKVAPAQRETRARWSDPFEYAAPDTAVPPVTPRVSAAAAQRRRRGILAHLFGTPKPSPYWGFRFQGQLINLAIGLVLVAAAGGVVLLIFLAVATLAAELEWQAKIAAVGLMLIQLVGLFLLTVLWVGVLVFYRNLIDWLIDMQDHAAAIRSQLTGKPRTD